MVWPSITTTSAWGIRGVFKCEVVIGDVIEFVVVVKVEVEVRGNRDDERDKKEKQR